MALGDVLTMLNSDIQTDIGNMGMFSVGSFMEMQNMYTASGDLKWKATPALSQFQRITVYMKSTKIHYHSPPLPPKKCIVIDLIIDSRTP